MSIEERTREMRAKMRQEYKFSCPDCGSEEIQCTAWMNMNTEEIISSGINGPRDVFFCPDCEEEVGCGEHKNVNMEAV